MNDLFLMLDPRFMTIAGTCNKEVFDSRLEKDPNLIGYEAKFSVSQGQHIEFEPVSIPIIKIKEAKKIKSKNAPKNKTWTVVINDKSIK